MFPFRTICAAAMTVVMLLTSQAMAISRGQAPAVGVVELCAGPVKMVYVDEAGTPVSAPRFCPDIALSLLAFVDAVPPTPARVDLPDRDLIWTLSEGRAPTQRLTKALARGPPDGV